MSDHYSVKVLLLRSIFLSGAAVCYFLYHHDQTDYVIVLSLVMLFLGIFSISTVSLTDDGVSIQKNYFWAIVPLRRELLFDQLTSIKTKDYEIEMHENDLLLSESILGFLLTFFYRPKVQWITSVLSYVDGGVEDNIELKISWSDHRHIEKKIDYRIRRSSRFL